MNHKLKAVYEINFKPAYEKYMACREGIPTLCKLLNKYQGLVDILDKHELRNVTLMLLDKNKKDVKSLDDLNSKLENINDKLSEYIQLE